MADLEFSKCGTCDGCALLVAIQKLVADIDACFIPRMATLRRRIASTYDRERAYGDRPGEWWRERAAAEALHDRRALRSLEEERGAWLHYVARDSWTAGCLRPVIRVAIAAQPQR